VTQARRRRSIDTCPSPKPRCAAVLSGCASFVTVVQAANFRERDHAAFFWRLHAAWRGRVFRQGEMGPRSVIVEDISGERAPQMRLVEDDHVVEALAANGSDQSLRIRILPRT
jgi:hypothetical protein